MDAKRAARWTGYYWLYLTAATLLGGGMTVAGFGMTYQTLDSQQWQSWGPFLTEAAPWLVLGVVGVAVYRFGSAFALYHTLSRAMAEELSSTYDTEKVKSDILSVLDQRLADMQSDIQKVADDDDEFEF